MARSDSTAVDDRSEYTAEVEDRLARRARRTSDHDDATVGWTAQQGAAPSEVSGEPAPYAPEQLPDPGVAIAAGLPPQQIPQNVIGDASTPRHEGGQQGVDPYRHPGVDLGDRANVTAEGQLAAYKDIQENGSAAGTVQSTTQVSAVPTPGEVVTEVENKPSPKAQSSTPGSTD